MFYNTIEYIKCIKKNSSSISLLLLFFLHAINTNAQQDTLELKKYPIELQVFAVRELY